MRVVGLENRLLREGDNVDLDKLTDVDFDYVKEKLGEQIDFSIDYLKQSLK